MESLFTMVEAMMRQFLFIEVVKKDLKSELKLKSIFSLSLIFATAVSFLLSSSGIKEPSVIFLIVLFTSLLSLSFIYLKEIDSGTIEALKLSPLTAQEIQAAKQISSIIINFLILSVVYPICFALFEVNGDFFLGYLSFILASSSIAVCVTSLSPLLSNSRARDLLLPVMIFPVIYPVLNSSVSAVENALNGVISYYSFQFVLFYSLALFVLSLLLADYLLP
ncbi:MAG: heme exporter protein CcmB [Archaeoglobaceae archaeon]|nr:heme exporter protein CcmB [Archaeoglobaceae archaeon]MCX8151856.1 heme exporter protein CcmB [Archaeoglobaceae archaeon]MDW8014312.1 heme exporter protein CcmB [Archaeoglobaceae archaeon]